VVDVHDAGGGHNTLQLRPRTPLGVDGGNIARSHRNDLRILGGLICTRLLRVR
jgi:hypothetical protein